LNANVGPSSFCSSGRCWLDVGPTLQCLISNGFPTNIQRLNLCIGRQDVCPDGMYQRHFADWDVKLSTAVQPSWSEGVTNRHNFGRGPSNTLARLIDSTLARRYNVLFPTLVQRRIKVVHDVGLTSNANVDPSSFCSSGQGIQD
jgi:hypothetical protein